MSKNDIICNERVLALIVNGETFIDEMGQKFCKENFSFTIGGFNNIGQEMVKISILDFDFF